MASQWLPNGFPMASQCVPNGFLMASQQCPSFPMALASQWLPSTVNWDMFACTDRMAKIGSDVMDLVHVFLLVPGQVGGSLQVPAREGPPIALTQDT